VVHVYVAVGDVVALGLELGESGILWQWHRHGLVEGLLLLLLLPVIWYDSASPYARLAQQLGTHIRGLVAAQSDGEDDENADGGQQGPGAGVAHAEPSVV
jgi:hypothetical protein